MLQGQYVTKPKGYNPLLFREASFCNMLTHYHHRMTQKEAPTSEIIARYTPKHLGLEFILDDQNGSYWLIATVKHGRPQSRTGGGGGGQGDGAFIGKV